MAGKDNNKLWKKYNFKWVVIITIWTFLLTLIISVVSEVLLLKTRLIFAFIILIIIILTGIVFDIIGIAITVASDKPFHAMAADKVDGAIYAIKLLNNAGPVSNFCNDVIGDICGIVSGAAGISIVLNLSNLYFVTNRAIIMIIISSCIAAMTVGGKAIGRSVAIISCHDIVFKTARFIEFVENKLKFNIIMKSKNKNEG